MADPDVEHRWRANGQPRQEQHAGDRQRAPYTRRESGQPAAIASARIATSHKPEGNSPIRGAAACADATDSAPEETQAASAVIVMEVSRSGDSRATAMRRHAITHEIAGRQRSPVQKAVVRRSGWFRTPESRARGAESPCRRVLSAGVGEVDVRGHVGVVLRRGPVADVVACIRRAEVADAGRSFRSRCISASSSRDGRNQPANAVDAIRSRKAPRRVSVSWQCRQHVGECSAARCRWPCRARPAIAVRKQPHFAPRALVERRRLEISASRRRLSSD